MSPARARTSTEEIIAAGRALLESGGLEAVTMKAVAARVVRAPSLYKRIPSRSALIAAIGVAALDDLHQSIAPASEDPDAAAGLRAVAFAYRSFAHANPRAYELLFMNLGPESRPPSTSNALAAAPLLALAERLVGPARTLEAGRLMTAFAHGFVSMELADQFRFGGDLDEAYGYGVDVLVDALAARSRADADPKQKGHCSGALPPGWARLRGGRRRERRLVPTRLLPSSWSRWRLKG
jgi:AcrR family transcriptional regulator